MSPARTSFLLALLGLSLGLATAWHHDPYYSFQADHLIELHQAKIALRTAHAQLNQQQAIINELRQKSNSVPPPPQQPTQSIPAQSSQPRAPTQPQPSARCNGCNLLSALLLLGAAAGLARASDRRAPSCCSGLSGLRKLLLISAAVFVGTNLFHFALAMAWNLLPMLLFLGPSLFLCNLFSGAAGCGGSHKHRFWSQGPSTSFRGAVPPTAPLAQGARGPDVAQLQSVLIVLKYMDPSAIQFAAGRFGPRTHQAILQVQKAMDVAPTGVYDQATKAHLEAELATTASAGPVPETNVPCSQPSKKAAPEGTPRSSPEVQEPTVTAPEPTESPAAPEFPTEWASSLADLQQMGFGEAEAKGALLETGGELKAAVRALVSSERTAK